MSDIQQSNPQTLRIDSDATILSMVPPEVRTDLNHAIIDRQPSTRKGIYEAFNLAQYGISLRTFYRYARVLRLLCAHIELAECISPDSANLPAAIPKMIDTRLMTMLALDDPSPQRIRCLVDAYRIAAGVDVHLRKHASLTELAERKDASMIYNVMNEFKEQVVRKMETTRLYKEAEIRAINGEYPEDAESVE